MVNLRREHGMLVTAESLSDRKGTCDEGMESKRWGARQAARGWQAITAPLPAVPHPCQAASCRP